MAERMLRLRLFGAFSANIGDVELDVRSTKAKALIALCATAPGGRRTRSFLQDTLWSLSGPIHGRASLRQTLSALRRILGDDFDTIFRTTNEAVGVDLEKVEFVGGPTDGPFLEGIDIPEHGFNTWLAAKRRSAPASPATDLPTPSRTIEQAFERVTPIIAVLPFRALEENGIGPHLGDVIAQDVTRSLSRSPYLRVISHLSARDRRLRGADLRQVRELLEVDYVIGGQVRLVGERFRLDVDFVDAATGELQWTRDFIGTVPSLFSGEDDVVETVADVTLRAVLQQSLTPLGVAKLPDIASHRLLMASITLMHRMELGAFAKSRELLEELLRRAPQHAILHAWLAKWYVLQINQGWSVDVQADSRRGRESAMGALEIDPADSFSLAIAGFVHHHLWELDEAYGLHEEALAINPNNSLAWLLKGALHAFRDEGAMAVSHTDRARTLSPLDPHRYLFDSIAASAYAIAGQYDKALSLANRSLAANRRHTSTLRVQAYALEMLDRHEEAVRAAGNLLRIDPTFTVEKYLSTHPAVQFGAGRRWAEVFARVGVPAT